MSSQGRDGKGEKEENGVEPRSPLVMGLDRHVNKWYLGQRPHLEGLGYGEIGSVWDKMGLGGHA